MKLADLSEFRRVVFTPGSAPDPRTLRKWFDEGRIEGARRIGDNRFVDLDEFTALTGDSLVDGVLRDTNVGRRRLGKNADLEDNLYFNGRAYQYRNPQTGRWKSLGQEKARANAAARKLNRILDKEADLVARVLETGEKTVGEVVAEFITDYLPNQALSQRTLSNYLGYYRRYQREFGQRMIRGLTRTEIGDWLAKLPSADSYNKHRTRLIDLWRFAIARGYVDDNEPEATLPRNQSKRIEANRRKRHRLEIDQFWAIHQLAPAWFQIAMELALVTLQGRNEIAHVRFDDQRGDHLYFIREKTEEISEMAFIRIRMTDQLGEIIGRARASGIASPFIVHYRPAKMKRDQMAAKKHWSQVTPNHLTRTFKRLREETGLFDDLPANEQPSFHEIRSLGARIYEQQGYAKDYIQSLMTHSDKKTTEIYLESGRQALTDDHYIPVRADLALDTLR
ncbi:hypothetical protein FAZ79_00280 [Guyparkeria sp. SB14A]|uniref:tyrosine-type recombinase/integrase n=1 Tax=Guyparkeria sp. SB14A TaxID=2571147 RepID=UPI0010AC5A0A|nr:tyrosine-type recombinase/integrase [Guyparkeria sp. SB14A]TKA91777.1 hypothetical protein FAZ79_00280 [Guyparkeria sp. SB14A]